MTPQFLGLHGNIRLEVAAETQTYTVHDAPSPHIVQESSREAKLAVASMELTQWIGRLAHIAGVAVFIDAASITGSRSRVAGSGSFADAGIGLRLRPSGQRGGLRLDLAFGLTDEGHAISLRWQPRWHNANRWGHPRSKHS